MSRLLAATAGSGEVGGGTKLEGGSVVERVYSRLKLMAVSFEFRPSERVNEVAISKQLGVSRTPLREALNRLVADGFLSFSPNRGFTGRALDVKEIFDLYEVRQKIETGAVSLAVPRVSDASLQDLSAYLEQSAEEHPERTIDDLLDLDEGFHERLIGLTGNSEMMRILKNINARIRFVRWIDMSARRQFTQGQHRAILQAIEARDAISAAKLLDGHINHRLDQVVHAVKEAYARIYVQPNVALIDGRGG